MDKYTNIKKTRDKEYLYSNLSDMDLQNIEYILEAYFSERIDLVFPDDYCGDFTLSVKDKSYTENGCELLVLKWCEDIESTDYMVGCMQESAYYLYIDDWCKSRGYTMQQVYKAGENGINGERYVGFDEFLDNEYQDEEYMEYLLGNRKEKILWQ